MTNFTMQVQQRDIEEAKRKAKGLIEVAIERTLREMDPNLTRKESDHEDENQDSGDDPHSGGGATA